MIGEIPCTIGTAGMEKNSRIELTDTADNGNSARLLVIMYHIRCSIAFFPRNMVDIFTLEDMENISLGIFSTLLSNIAYNKTRYQK